MTKALKNNKYSVPHKIFRPLHGTSTVEEKSIQASSYKMSQAFSRDILRTVVAQICQTIGWHGIQTTPLDLMVDLLHRYLEDLSRATHSYAEQFGQTIPNLDHLGLVFQDLGINLTDLEDYVRNVESVPCAHNVPVYPVKRPSHLNFLKPGSNEVVHRPVHVHEHLPPMHPDMEDAVKQPLMSIENPSSSADGLSPQGGVFKRPGDLLESPALKRTRLLLEEEGRPLREISSVIMTTSGFLSPAREGKLPESRPPIIPSESDYSPTPPSYPTVPPDVKGDKKTKKSPGKKFTPGSKKLEKENKKKEMMLKEAAKTEKLGEDQPKVKKLASMKELSKLKALKPGAKKLSSSVLGGPAMKPGNPKDFATFIENLSKASTPAKSKPEKAPWPGPTPAAKETPSTVETIRDTGVVEGKLSSEPDKQKLNIFKKISKVKDERTEKLDRDETPQHSRESSPGLIIDENAIQTKQKESRLAQIDECIDAVLQFSQSASSPLSFAAESSTLVDSEDEIYISDDFSPPGTPSTPKTPELPSISRKIEKLGEKKKKKEKNKSKISRDASSPKKIKIEQIDLELSDRPKTPQGHTEGLNPLLFPFNSHLPPAPGIVPPPLVHPLFSGLPSSYPKPLGSGVPHPAMPNLPMPPPLFMQPRGSENPDISIIAIDLEKPEEKEKISEKKSKEHKKDKKEEKKPKKKKDKKEKIKNKEKGEKRKEDKKDREKDKEKSKEKKEKKEKRKEREREEKQLEGSVPKLTLKLGPASPRPLTPDTQARKIVIKPVVKKEDVAPETKRAPSPELARISALVTRPPKHKLTSKSPINPPVEASSDHASNFRPKTPEAGPSSHQAAPTLIIKTETKGKDGSKKMSSVAGNSGKESVAFYHHARARGPAKSQPPRVPASASGASRGDDAGNKVWICPACEGPDDGSPMIGCDDCDAWYHWVCVGIQVPPDDKEDWYCRECIIRKQELVTEKKKKNRKKKV